MVVAILQASWNHKLLVHPFEQVHLLTQVAHLQGVIISHQLHVFYQRFQLVLTHQSYQDVKMHAHLYQLLQFVHNVGLLIQLR